MWQQELFGESLHTSSKSGSCQTSTLTSKKRVGIYFSAHWCPPCRRFTPTLAAFYDMVKEQNPDDLEIVFVSSDKGEAEFNEYFSEMPWLALPYQDRERAEKLKRRFNVSGIPTFVVLDGATGEVKDMEARDTVADAQGNIEQALRKW